MRSTRIFGSIVLLQLILGVPARAELFPRDTPEWRMWDAIAQLTEPRSTELERVYACAQLSAAVSKPAELKLALQLAVKADPSPAVRQGAYAAAVKLGIDAEVLKGIDAATAEQIVTSFKLAADEEDRRARIDKQIALVRAAERASKDLSEARLGRFWENVDATKGFLTTVPRNVAAAIRQLPAAAIDLLDTNTRELAAGTVHQRRAAAARLAMYPGIAGPATAALTRALKDEDAQVRDAAARALGTPQAKRIAARGTWVEQLSDPDESARVVAAEALRADGFADRRTMDAVVAAVANDGWLARRGLADAVARAWHDDITVADALDRAAKDSHTTIDRTIVAAARKVLDRGVADAQTLAAERKSVVNDLKQQVAGTNPSAARTAVRLLRESGVTPAELVEALSKATLADDPSSRHEATEALIIAGDAGVPALAAMLKDSRREVKGLALVQLGRMAATAAPAAGEIAKHLTADDALLRLMAARALGAIGPRAAATSIDALAAARLDPDEDVVVAAARAGLSVAPADRRFAPLGVEPPAAHVRDELLASLRGQELVDRHRAAARIADEQFVPKKVSDALTRAVDAGDYATREGLALGIARAWIERRDVAIVMGEMFGRETDARNRACLKAGLRAITPVD